MFYLPEMLSFTSPIYSNSVQNPSREQVREMLLNVFYASRKLALDYAPLNHSQIASLASKVGAAKNASELAKLISATKQSVLEAELSKLVVLSPATVALDADGGGAEIAPKKQKGAPVEFAFSLYFNCLLEKMLPPAVKLATASKAPSEVKLVANFGGWMAVRKVSIERQERKEVVACCATIFESVRKKLPEFFCAQGKEGEYNSVVDSFISKFPERKSFSRLPEILSAAEKEESKIVSLAERGFEKPLLDAFYCRVFSQVGFPCFVSTDQVSRIYPDLKIPKPRGRMAGSGKKK